MADGGKKMGSSSQALVSVAMLKVSLDQEGRDYIDQLNSFVKAALPTLGAVVDVNALAAAIFERFGLRVPVAVVERALKRLAKQGVIQKDNALYTVVKENGLDEFNLRRQQASSDISKVVTSFQDFHEKSFEVKIDERDAHDAFISFVSKHAIECLRSYVYRTALPKIQHDTQQSYAVARFVNDAFENRPELFKLILVVFKGVMLANSFTCPDLDAISRNFSGVTFYLDTPPVLSLLGFHGPNDANKLRELVTLIKDLKGEVAVFEHTSDEVDAVLAWCEGAIQRKSIAQGRVVLALQAEGKGHSDIVLMRAKVSEKLASMGVALHQTPKYIERLQIDERSLEGILTNEVGYPRERAIQYDINSVRSIYALRDGHVPKRIEDSKAVFVTSNSSFARAAFSFSRKYEVARQVSPVVTDYSVANIAWLKSPTRAAQLPKHELLAMCFAALEPSDSAWSKFLVSAEALHQTGRISSDDLAILRADGRARQDVMDLTIGADEDFNSDDVQVVLDRIKKRLVAERDEEIQGKQAVIAEFRRELDVAYQEKAAAIASMRENASNVEVAAQTVARRSVITVWLIVAGSTLASPFLTLRDGISFWFVWAFLVIFTAGPVVAKMIGIDLLRSIPRAWGESRRRKWIEGSVPREFLEEFHSSPAETARRGADGVAGEVE